MGSWVTLQVELGARRVSDARKKVTSNVIVREQEATNRVTPLENQGILRPQKSSGVRFTEEIHPSDAGLNLVWNFVEVIQLNEFSS